MATLARIPTDRMHLRLMLALTFTTGVVDAVGYLGLDRVFTGNMTGNVVILGMGVVGAEDLPVLGPLLALLGFMAGAALGGRVLKRAARAWSGLSTTLFAVVAVIVLALGAVIAVAGEHPGPAVALPVTTLLAAAMGVQASVARFIAVQDVTTVVVTSTITGLAADSVLGNGTGGRYGRRVSAILLLVAGAAVGALLLQWHLAAGLTLAGLVIASVTMVGALHARVSGSAAEAPLP